MGGCRTTTLCLVALNVREGTFKLLQMVPSDIQLLPHLVDLVVCDGSLLLVIYHDDHNSDQNSVTLMKAD